MTPVPVGPPVAVVGTPGDRRVTLFAAALRRHGLPEPHVVAWRDVLAWSEALAGREVLGGHEAVAGRDVLARSDAPDGWDVPPAPRFPEGAIVRVESPGEDAAADALLRGPGDPSRVGGGATWHARFVRALESVRDAVARTPGARLAGDVGEIAVMFDKRLCHARLAAAGVPVPPALPGPVRGYTALRAAMREAGWARVFVKPAHGSSASGVVALQAHGPRIKATTSVELESAGRLHNSLRVRSYEHETDVAAIVDALAPDGLHVERWFPKASVGGRVFDLRVVVTGGRPTHAVVRTSHAPMTNLHLGGRRGDLAMVRATLGESGWARAMDVCAAAAACFPRSPAVGVDLMLEAGRWDPAVAEVNAFGDLLPGLTGLPGGGAEGLDTYEAQVELLLGSARTAGRR
ncbi:STM4014 family protein [Nonomuraea sp. NPDC050691]|uniref:STM4014 family protein n=1 Tax=Nonomuraea sp. NPDC050691 TaxID=3155661 RepID=UPI0033BFC5C2